MDKNNKQFGDYEVNGVKGGQGRNPEELSTDAVIISMIFGLAGVVTAGGLLLQALRCIF